MSIIPLVLKEFEQEAQITRKMLQLVPTDKFDWKPHEKSMTMMQLTTHIAELPGWVSMAMHTTEMDFAAQPYTPTLVNSNEELLNLFETGLVSGRTALENAKEEDLWPTWTLRSGEQVFMVLTKYEVIRHSIAQTIHHRAQLGVYLRLLNIPIPGSYGPSADDQNF